MPVRNLWLLLVLVLVVCSLGGGTSQAQEDIDFNRARQLRQRAVRGEPLTEEEREYLDRAIQARAAGQAPAGRTPLPADRLIPLSDMTADDRYRGEDGGLYGAGRNTPPEDHARAALERARSIQPVAPDGTPDPDGKIVLISVGMSNTTQEFSQFQRLAAEDPDLSHRLVIVDGAQGGMDARAWAQPDQVAQRNPNRRVEPWQFLEQRLSQSGVTPAQVQVVWIKQALINPGSIGEFPRHTRELEDFLVTILQTLQEKYPNLKLAYLSSRIYAGYAGGPLNPEPYAYESAFAVRHVIQLQMSGNPALNWDPMRGEVRSPLLLWGPYLWADGEQGRQLDDLVYLREDLANDGTHPSPSGRRKVAELLLQFFKTDPTASLWFLNRS